MSGWDQYQAQRVAKVPSALRRLAAAMAFDPGFLVQPTLFQWLEQLSYMAWVADAGAAATVGRTASWAGP